jgi:glycosyltransferase involved in cell wall biosynthesis
VKSAAIAIVRNAVDIAPLTALHHWLLGVDRVCIIDNGSTDGTYEALLELQARLPTFRVERDAGPFDQASMTNRLANELLREGFDLLIPFDADECWHLTLARVAAEFRRNDANVLSFPVVNYIQSRSVLRAEPGSWKWASRRVARAINPQMPIARAVGTQRISFVERAFGRKILVAPPPGARVKLIKGNHSVTFEGERTVSLRTLPCLHLPLRAASELEKRVVDYKDRHTPFRVNVYGGWRLDYWAERLQSGQLEAEWAANSFDAEGMIDVYGQRRQTIVDRRLVRHLRRAERFRAALELTGGKIWLPLRMAFKVRAPRFKAPKNLLGLDNVPPERP